ncbi:DUF6461 domain-containing protein [Nonomuraea sp. NPDC050153]|uniref:DUF6461 domain-containing protein n=1 Tax=Nonomuraea sp. NPDC050153 TaxID=3364359 RepID=UPI0037BB561D
MREKQAYYLDVVGYFDETMCVTWAEGLDVDAVAVVFGSGLDTGRRYDIVEAENEGFEAREIAGWPCSAIAGRLGDWSVVVEPTYGDKGSNAETLRDLSARGRALNAFSGVTSHAFDYWAAGEQVTSLTFIELNAAEPFHRGGGSPQLLDDVVNDFHSGEVVAFRAFALALCEHLAQERLTHDWLFTKHRWLLWEDLDDWS